MAVYNPRAVQTIFMTPWSSVDKAMEAKAELPMVLFNRICYGYLNNDWPAVITSSLILLKSIQLIFQGDVDDPGTNP
jgi:hypothetical protein